MTDLWFYGHGSELFGPFSGKQLAGLAAAGDLVRTDTVWKDGVERGVSAVTVRNLFPAAPAEVAPPAPVEPVAEVAAAAEAAPLPRLAPPRRARATAGKGAVIVGQDGTTVKFRKKCTTCGYEDTSWKTLPITRGTTRIGFYCPKCRRKRDAEINGTVS